MKHTNNPHIIYILTKLELGGAQKICLALFDGVATQEMTTALITGAEGTLIPIVKDKKNVILIGSLLRQATFSSIRQDLACLKELIRLLRVAKKNHPGLIVHTHSTKAGVLGRVAAWCASVKVVHTIHGYGFHERQPKIIWLAIYAIELLLSAFTTHYLCVSRADAKTGIRLFPGFTKKHTIIRAAVDQRLFKRPIEQAIPFPQSPQPFIFGTISCFKPQKNLKDLIRAFAWVHAQQPHAQLEIVGDGEQRAELEKLIHYYKLGDVVKLHGWQHDVQTYTKRWHTFVLSSLWEGLPCAIIEARLLHIPVVCYDTGGINEVVLHGQNGFLVERGNWQLLADHMMKLITSPELYSRFQTYLDDFTDFEISAMIQQHTMLYRSLIKNHTHPLKDAL
ncbi:glycosyltransferase [Candidatus Dependentiae bacterium]|nr:glycosyltransferase [Candidatus Dependentiae bacterium]MCC7414752.1 glycosyltransferase [Campylobacterota bacterium]